MLSPTGVDGVFVLTLHGNSGGSGKRVEGLRQQFLNAWNVAVVPVPPLSEGEGSKIAGCLGVQAPPGVCKKLWGCRGGGRCLQHMFVAYMAMQNGLANVLVVHDTTSVPQIALGSKWGELLQQVPAAYDFAALGKCGLGGGGECAGGYLMSLNGARRVLSGSLDGVRISNMATLTSWGCG